MPDQHQASELAQRLGIGGSWGGLGPPDWAAYAAARSAHRWPDIRETRRRAIALGFDDQEQEACVRIRDKIDRDADLDQLARHVHVTTFGPAARFDWHLPSLHAHLGTDAGACWLFLSTGFEPALRACHAARGYPPEVTADTLRQPACFALNHRRSEGTPGIHANQVTWLAAYLLTPYVRLGRLEFQLRPFRDPVQAWRRDDGAWLAVAEGGLGIDADGLRARPGCAAWTTSWHEDGDAVEANPIHPAGRIERRTVRLDRRSWRRVLARGDDILDLHIPAGGSMDWEQVRESFGRALPFFGEHHPARPVSAFFCHTWFLDPRLPGLLGEEANPVRLQRSVWCMPGAPDPDGPWFVFLRNPSRTPVQQLPRDTRVQRAIADFLAAGGTWHGGDMLLMPDEAGDLRPGRHHLPV